MVLCASFLASSSIRASFLLRLLLTILYRKVATEAAVSAENPISKTADIVAPCNSSRWKPELDTIDPDLGHGGGGRHGLLLTHPPSRRGRLQ